VTEHKHEDKAAAPGGYMIPANNAFAHAWKMAAAVAAVGLLISVAGYMADPRRFAFSYLMGFWTVFTMALGTTFFVLLQHLTGAGWSVTVRRAAEFFSAGMIVIPFLMIPNALNYETLLPWTSFFAGDHVAHAQEHGHEGHDHGDHGHDHGAHGGGHDAHGAGHAGGAHGGGHHLPAPEHALHERITQAKFWYLTPGFLGVRGVVCVILLALLALRFFKNSTSQDKDGSPTWTVKSARSAPVATMLYALAMTFLAFDWVMGLEPNWYSTMFGVRVFGSSAVLGLSLTMLLCLGFMRTGLVKREINVEHIHDLGKLMFGFLVFWAYVSFCEFMLIWYAAIPEETAYYHRRWDFQSWQLISISIVVVKFIMPFFLIMSRNVKRNLGVIGFGAAWIAALHLVEMYYWIMPYYAPDTDVPFSVMGMATDVGCILLCVGIYLAVVFKRMLNHPIIPVRDPRLQRALDFVQV
jgi:hypothetical protein